MNPPIFLSEKLLAKCTQTISQSISTYCFCINICHGRSDFVLRTYCFALSFFLSSHLISSIKTSYLNLLFIIPLSHHGWIHLTSILLNLKEGKACSRFEICHRSEYPSNSAWLQTQKRIFFGQFCINFLAFSSSFQLLCTKNIEKGIF